ncbi:MAG: hypothetical protein WDZ94_05355 [Patescibacteria group bacterium]
MQIWQQRWFQWAILILLCLWLAALYMQRINFTASDLGRHLMNGQVILQSGSVFSTNFYSFTNSEFSVPNHHWLFGVLAFLVYQMGGFELLSLTGMALSMAGVLIMVFGVRAFQRQLLLPLSGGLFLLLPILAHRAEVRPEAVSLVIFSGLTILTWRWLRSKTQPSFPWKFTLIWVLTMFFWVNTHIFFIFGGVILGAAGFQLLAERDWVRLRQLVGIGLAAASICLLNPVGLQGILFPLQIFNNYAYRVAENQSIWFFLQYHPRPYYVYLTLAVLVFNFLAAVPLLRRKKSTKHLFPNLLVLIFSLLTAFITRYESIFALVALFWIGSGGWQQIKNWLALARQKIPETIRLSLGSVIGGAVLISWLTTANIAPIGMQYGLGLLPANRQSAAFFKSLEIEGNLFNNYDIGGFLIFDLYPETRVFVDNRPEAYPGDFMINEYIAAQTDEVVWEAMVQRYDLGAIYFYRHDMTNWGQAFMIRRIRDEAWEPIYVDDYVLILVKDTPAHQEIIEQYQLPAETFALPG